MELFQDVTIKLKQDSPGFQQALIQLVKQSEEWIIREDFQESFKKRGLLKDREVLCIETPVIEHDGRSLHGVIWMYDYGTWLQIFNIIPLNPIRFSKKEYNFILNEFIAIFIKKIADDYHAEVIISKPIMEINDYVDKDVYDALVVFSDMANKSTGHSHPMDGKRWCDFVLLSASKERRLSVDFLEGWLIDHGWSSKMASYLGLDYEYGITLLDYEHNRR